MIEIRAGVSWGDCAILFRTNAQSRAFEEVFLSDKVPYIVVGGTDFWKRKEVQDLVAYLRLAVEDDDGAFVRCVNRPFRYIGKVSIEKIGEQAGKKGLSCFSTVAANPYDPAFGLKTHQGGSLSRFVTVIHDVQRMLAKGSDLPTVLSYVLTATGYQQWIQREEGSDTSENSRISNIRELVRTVGRFSTPQEFFAFLKELDKQKRKKKDGKQADVVQLMSIHKAKGLEFPVVFLAGASEGILPHARTEDVEEERRLFYVGVTRAKDRLFVTSPGIFMGRGGSMEMQQSRFIQEAGLSERDR